MTTLTADDKMRAILDQAKGLAEVRDATGQVIGFYAPIAFQNASASVHIDTQEIARRKASTEKGRTTREVFEHLLTLTQDEVRRQDLLAKIEVLKERDRCGAP